MVTVCVVCEEKSASQVAEVVGTAEQEEEKKKKKKERKREKRKRKRKDDNTGLSITLKETSCYCATLQTLCYR